jgi:HAD superfamily hydrolase (TIGR01490 family)
MAGSSAFQFGRASYAAGLYGRRELARDALDNLRFRLRGSTDEATDLLRARIFAALAGVRVTDLRRLAPRVLAGILPRLYPEMLALAHAHQDAGRRAYIVTAASQELAELLAHVLAFDGAIGSRSEIADGVYTGRPDGPFTYREGKAVAMRELAAAEGIDLAASYAYSDSESDLPMLRAVGHPVAVNPDRELEAVARGEGWEVMRLEPLHRRLRVAVAVLAAAVAAVPASGAGRMARARRAGRTPPPRRRAPRARPPRRRRRV